MHLLGYVHIILNYHIYDIFWLLLSHNQIITNAPLCITDTAASNLLYIT
jgi:hypothetical protein